MENVVVVDHGSDTIKAGYAHSVPDRGPQVIVQSAVTAAGDEAMDGSTPALLRPIRRGVVQDWEMMESIYNYILYEQLCWVPGEEGSIVLAEPLLTSKASRESYAQLMFETFNVSGLFISEQPILSVYGAGKLTGICVDVGAEKIDICPVLEGTIIYPALKRQEFGLGDVDAYIQSQLARRGVSATLADARSVKHALSDVPSEAGAAAPAGEATHQLPDGRTITVGAERHAAAEGLFGGPTCAGLREPGATLSDEVLGAISGCLPEYRRTMFESVLLCGGGSALKGLSARILADVSAAAPGTISAGMAASPDYMPDDTLANAAWYGGAIVAKTVFPQNQHISRLDYHEQGPGAAWRRLG